MDALALPMLGILIAVFMVYVWNAWLKNPDDRAINIRDDQDLDEPPPQ